MEATFSYLLMLEKHINSSHHSEPYPLCLGNISNDFTLDNMKKKKRWKGSVKVFSVDYNPIDTSSIVDIHRYLMIETWHKIMFRIIKKMFIVSLSSLANTSSIASSHTKCVSLSNQKCLTQPTVINLHPSEYTQGLRYYPFSVNLNRCVGSCNTLNDLSNKVCVQNNIEDLNLSVFNMITGINE